MKTIGFLGGTFDPVHKGHLQMALEAKVALQLDECYMLPCHQPYHRDRPQLTSAQRLALLQLAVAEYEGLLIDDRELGREGNSYTIDTLLELRAEHGEDCSLVLLMGVDAYQSFEQWHRWQEIESLAHIVVIGRPGYQLDAGPALVSLTLDSDHARHIVETLHREPSGSRLFVALSAIDVSATSIRESLSAGHIPESLPDVVAKAIYDKQLYGYRPQADGIHRASD